MNTVIKSKQLELLYSHLPSSILTGYIAAFFVAYILWDYVDHSSFILWLAGFNIIMLYRVGILVFYKKIQIKDVSLKLLDRLNFISTLLTGLIWGLLTFYYSKTWPTQIQVPFWILFIALMSGASASFSVVIRYYLSYSLPIFLFSIYELFITENYYITIIFFFYMFLLSITSYNFNKAQKSLITQQYALLESNTHLQSLATRDALTNLPNRRAFDEYLKKEWARHVRSDLVMSLVMIDVDYFKNYNDHYGHDKGDECLKIIAEVIERCLHRQGSEIWW